MRRADRHHLRIKCPRCDAAVDAVCVSYTGRPVPVHSHRLLAARAADREAMLAAQAAATPPITHTEIEQIQLGIQAHPPAPQHVGLTTPTGGAPGASPVIDSMALRTIVTASTAPTKE